MMKLDPNCDAGNWHAQVPNLSCHLTPISEPLLIEKLSELLTCSGPQRGRGAFYCLSNCCWSHFIQLQNGGNICPQAAGSDLSAELLNKP
ncbi:hypothetical protein AMECASPLE_036566, partial [Ameca splendens]